MVAGERHWITSVIERERSGRGEKEEEEERLALFNTAHQSRESLLA
jgi:hypothetical protein